MAGAFTNQPRSTPITNQQQATQLGQGDFSSLQQQQFGQQPFGNQMQGFGGQPGGMNGNIYPPGQGFGGQPGGMNGNIYPLGLQFGHTTIYAVVESGQPIIIDPKTGKKYPPGYIPTIQDPNTWEQWQPGQSWTETMKLANAEFKEGMRQAQETLIRPGEEAAANTVQGFMQDLSKAANKWSGQAAQGLYGKDNQTLKDIQSRASQTGQQVINQAPQIAQQAIKQAPQAARQVGQSASQVMGRTTRRN